MLKPKPLQKTMPRSHDFSQTREQWEQAVFDEAVEFTVSMFEGRGSRNTERYSRERFETAKTLAKTWRGKHGQRATLHAVTAAGRMATLDEKDWDAWTARYIAAECKIATKQVREFPFRYGKESARGHKIMILSPSEDYVYGYITRRPNGQWRPSSVSHTVLAGTFEIMRHAAWVVAEWGHDHIKRETVG